MACDNTNSPYLRLDIDRGTSSTRGGGTGIQPTKFQGESRTMARYLLVTTTLCLLVGCQTVGIDAKKTLTDKLPTLSSKPGKSTPVSIAAIWSDAVYTQAGQKPVRGFGGRLYFYNEKHEAVPVDGQLIVYGYDESTRDDPNRTPDRKFVFTPEQFTSHHSVTELGDSYSIWIPWDELGGMKKTVTLLPVFVPTGGQLIAGQQTINILPGKSPPAPPAGGQGTCLASAASRTSPAVRQVSYEGEFGPGAWQVASPYTDPNAPNAPRMQTTTIQLPQTTAQRLIQQTENTSAPLPAGLTPLRSSDPVQTQLLPDTASTATTAALEGCPPAEQTSTRFERPRYRVPREASWRRAPDPPLSPPGLAAPPSALPSRP